MEKSATGITGFDRIAGGGLPSRRSTLVEGAAGTGKTVFALQTLVHGMRNCNESGIFVSFEESIRNLKANAASFDWPSPGLDDGRLYFLDARPDPDLVRIGDFDLGGLLTVIGALVAKTGARRIVFDAIDVVLDLLEDRMALRREIYRLHNWLAENDLTAIITSKRNFAGASSGMPQLEFIHYLVDCSLQLNHEIVDGVSQRNVRISKYRGTIFEENEVPYVIDKGGFEVAHMYGQRTDDIPASTHRISSGVIELDRMLEGGYFRGASILLTGAPGTAKTTLCGAFASAACATGEKVLFVSFDSRPDEIIRNLASVSIELHPLVDADQLRVIAMPALSGSAEKHLLAIRSAAIGHGATVLIVDPISAFSKAGNRGLAPSVAERLIDWAKSVGITTLSSSLLDETVNVDVSTSLKISTIADTWIHLSHFIHGGERNRGLSIVKSRGTGHSNQVRELILSDEGVTLAAGYSEDGEVLMGSLRWARERRSALAAQDRAKESERLSASDMAEARELEDRIFVLQGQLDARLAAAAQRVDRTAQQVDDVNSTRRSLHELRDKVDPVERGGHGRHA